MFLANVSHEIRTPMNGILSLSSLIAEQSLNKDQFAYMNQLQQCGNTLLDLINDILDLSKIEFNAIMMESVPFNFLTMIENIQAMGQTLADQKDLSLSFTIDESVPDNIIGDAKRLRQCLLNLVSNAIKFTESGKVSVWVAYADDDRMQITVRDSGIGIPAERLDRIFDPFVQADESTSRKFGGTGLGLAITRKLIELMDGTISVTSSAGEGSTFVIELPIEQASQSKLKAVETLKIPNWRDRRVLVVEDNPVNVTVISAFLHACELDITVANNGRLALDAIHTAVRRNAMFEVILMDCHMPEMDGFETTRTLRTELGFADLPIIALTADAVAGADQKCYDAGMNDYLTKPIDRHKLYHLLSKYLTATPA